MAEFGFTGILVGATSPLGRVGEGLSPVGTIPLEFGKILTLVTEGLVAGLSAGEVFF